MRAEKYRDRINVGTNLMMTVSYPSALPREARGEAG
jgi:hypothetical protein